MAFDQIIFEEHGRAFKTENSFKSSDWVRPDSLPGANTRTITPIGNWPMGTLADFGMAAGPFDRSPYRQSDDIRAKERPVVVGD